mmetsp:Transcript_20892/g.29312  ORF Transcript_20892/g.29312 Transcript_20892/m.29312 type:complete len:82 (+) Transcript_20892:374-619(+)
MKTAHLEVFFTTMMVVLKTMTNLIPMIWVKTADYHLFICKRINLLMFEVDDALVCVQFKIQTSACSHVVDKIICAIFSRMV